MLTLRFCLYLSLVVYLVPHSDAAVDEDEVTKLPGLSYKPSFKHYSGYLKATGTRKLHYWFVESAQNPKNDPVVLWLNGGPGCSSLDGFLSEHGPFLVNEDGSALHKNLHSWNNVANMLYMEAPAGVGFSYSDDRNYTTGDNQVSLDNFEALKFFFANFPEYSTNDFYVFGESYGGIYVPTLSVRVAAEKSIPFKGFGIGNGITDYSINDNSLIYFSYFHGLLGANLWKDLVTYCCKDGLSQREACDFSQSESLQCQKAVSEAQAALNGLNIYNLYDECHPPPSHSTKNVTIIHPIRHLFMKNKYVQQTWKKLLTSGKRLVETPPCVDVTGLTNYLNQANVRQALHIPTKLPKWEICSGIVGGSYQREYQTMREQYSKLLDAGNYRLLVFNGDIDMACNFLGDEWFTDDLNRPLKEQRKSWSYTAEDGSTQIAGYIKQFENLNVVTIRGAGHMVPQDKPIAALKMFSNYLNNV